MPLSPQYYLSDAAELESLAYRTTDGRLRKRYLALAGCFRETALRVGAPSGRRAEHGSQDTDGADPIG